MNRRRILYSGGVLGALSLTGMASMCSKSLTPATIVADIATACGILVPAATVASVINAEVGATASVIVGLFCTGLHNATASHPGGAAPKTGEAVDFVVVAGGVKIPVHAVYK